MYQPTRRVWSLDYIFAISGGARIVSTDPRSDSNRSNRVSSVLPSPDGPQTQLRDPPALRFHRYSALHFESYLFLPKAPGSTLHKTLWPNARMKLKGRCSIRLSYGRNGQNGKLVGVERFELPTSCSQSRRATRLRYTPCSFASYLQSLRNIRIMALQVNHYQLQAREPRKIA